MIPLLAAALALAACENPVQVGDEEHAEAGGVVILDAGTGEVLARSLEGRRPFDRPLRLAAGQAVEVQVRFLDAADPDDLDHAFAPHEEEGESLRVTVGNPAVATFLLVEEGDGEVRGVAPGTTTLRFDLMHGEHPDFESGDLMVEVTP